jgi:hypothetical protein
MDNSAQATNALEALKQSFATKGWVPSTIEKATYSQSNSAITGLTYYDLEPGAKLLYPFLTPLRNMIPRVSGRGGIQANWRAVTAIDTTSVLPGVSVGNRNAVMAVTTKEYTAAYRGLGNESNVDFEAQLAGRGFEDVRSLAAMTGLQALMLGEEYTILGGNGTTALGTPGTVTVATSTTGGAIPNNTQVSVIVVGLTLQGVLYGSVAAGVRGSFTRTNADGSQETVKGGTSAKSSAVNVTTGGSGGAHVVSATVPVLNGAMGYAWFWGPVGSERLGAITTINSVVITTAQGTSAAPQGKDASESQFSADASVDSLVFDGLLTQAFAAGSGATIYSMATGTAGVGTPLTADAAGGIVEIDYVLKQMWDLYRLSPDTMWVGSQESNNISRKILTGNSSAAQRFVFNADQNALGGGIMVRTYLNKFSMQGGSVVDIKIHPNMPAGTILFTSKSIPYPLSGVGNVFQIRTRQEYYQIEWPLRTRKYEYGVYVDEVLQHFAPFSMAVIRNIANG